MAKKTYSVKVLKPQTNSLAEMWEAFSKSQTDWSKAFYASYGNIFSKLTKEMLDKLDFSESGKVSRMDGMFSYCTSLTSIPAFDTSSVTSMSTMFYNCTSLTTIPLLNTSNVTSMNSMFYYCTSLTSIPLLNTSNVTDMYGMFRGCRSLTAIPALDVSKAKYLDAFYECRSLTEFHATGMKVSFSLSFSTKMSETALVEVLNNLATVTSTQTLTLGSTNLNKLTAEEKAIATQKGWTLS